jgi:hypothetical protein
MGERGHIVNILIGLMPESAEKLRTNYVER